MNDRYNGSFDLNSDKFNITSEIISEKEAEILHYLQTAKLEGELTPPKIKFNYLFEKLPQLIPINNLKVHPDVQRYLRHKNTKKIAKSIMKFGYFPEYPLVINDKGLIVAGQHRYVAARQVLAGTECVPCIVIKFESLKDEAAYFDYTSSFQYTKLDMMERIKAKKIAGDEFVLFMYKLAEDPNCLLYGQAKLPGFATSTKLFSPMIVFKIIGFALTGSAQRSQWDEVTQKRLERKIKNTPYHQIVREVNFLLNLYYKLYGYTKEAMVDEIFYKHRFIMAFLIFIKKVLDEDTILMEEGGEVKFLRGMKKMVISGPDRMLVEAWGLFTNLLIANFKMFVNKKSSITPYISHQGGNGNENEDEQADTGKLDEVFSTVEKAVNSQYKIPDTQICNGPSDKKKVAAFKMGVQLPHGGKPKEFPLTPKFFHKHKNQKYGFRTVCAECVRLGNKNGDLSRELISNLEKK